MSNSNTWLDQKCDEICDKILSGIRFSPYCPQSDLRTDGIHQVGLGGIGYGYWKSPKIMALHKDVRILREVSKRELSFSEVKEIVEQFIDHHINPLVAGRFDWQSGEGSLLEKLDVSSVAILRQSFKDFITAYVDETWFWLPLSRVSVNEYRGNQFAILPKPHAPSVDPQQLSSFLARPVLGAASSYLGVKARNADRAIEKSAIVLGAVMLCMHSGTQFSHTGGTPASGILSFEDSLTYRTSSDHVPYLATPISLTDKDSAWLSSVDRLLAKETQNTKIIRSLQWFRASWFLKGAERLSSICQAVDAVTPSKLNTMRAKCAWIDDHLSFQMDPQATQLLFKNLRSDVAHGDAPSLVESQAYLRFLEQYNVDPLEAAFEIARHVILENFLQKIIVRKHPLANRPDLLEKTNMAFRRYGMTYHPPVGFDFSAMAAPS